MAEILFGVPLGFLLWFFVRYGVGGVYTVGPNERAVLSTFGRAQRLGGSSLEDPIAQALRPDERDRYKYPQVRVIGPGFYWKLPWQNARKVSVATNTVSSAYDPEDPQANSAGRVLVAVTKDQLNTGLNGRQAAVAFAQAAATRPRIVGAALGEIAKDPVIASALFELLETQNLLLSPGLEVSVLPAGTQFVAAIPGHAGSPATR